MGQLVKGTDLTNSLRTSVLRRYPHRHMSGMTDEKWLETHAFYVTKDGRLDNRYHHCEPAFMAN